MFTFTFHWSELLVVIVCGLGLFLGLAFLMLRRRNDLLQEFLTPDEPNIEEEFFRVHTVAPQALQPEDIAEEPAETTEEETAHWGTQTQ